MDRPPDGLPGPGRDIVTCPGCGRVVETGETICRLCGAALRPGFPRQLVLLPLAFLLLVLALLFLAFLLGG